MIWTLFGLVYLATFVVAGGSLAQLKRFLAGTAGIADQTSLERYKKLVRAQMYIALAVISLMGVGSVLSIMIVIAHGMSGLLVVVTVNSAGILMGLYHRHVEVKARRLTATAETTAEYRLVSEKWLKKALPDF